MDVRLSLLVVQHGLGIVGMFRFTYRTLLFVTSFIVHSISSTRLPAILRSRVQTLPLATCKASSTWLRAQWPFSPGCPASSNYAENTTVRRLFYRAGCICVRSRFILTRTGCVVAKLCLYRAAYAPSTALLWWRVVAETHPCDVASSTCDCTCRPRRPEAPVPTSVDYAINKHMWILKCSGCTETFNCFTLCAFTELYNMFQIMIPISKMCLSEVPYFCESLYSLGPTALNQSQKTNEIKNRSAVQSDALPLRSHFITEQLRVWTDGPTHGGMMPLQDRPLCCPPRPQVMEQWVHSDQGDQPSSFSVYKHTSTLV